MWKKTLTYNRPDPFNFFNGCLPQILPGPFLNTFSRLFFIPRGVIINWFRDLRELWFPRSVCELSFPEIFENLWENDCRRSSLVRGVTFCISSLFNFEFAIGNVTLGRVCNTVFIHKLSDVFRISEKDTWRCVYVNERRFRISIETKKSSLSGLRDIPHWRSYSLCKSFHCTKKVFHPADFVTFMEEILNVKLHILWSVCMKYRVWVFSFQIASFILRSNSCWLHCSLSQS